MVGDEPQATSFPWIPAEITARVPPIPRLVIELLPLYHGTAMLRQLTTGAVDRTLALHVGYLVILGVTAFAVAMRRLDRALIK